MDHPIEPFLTCTSAQLQATEHPHILQYLATPNNTGINPGQLTQSP